MKAGDLVRLKSGGPVMAVEKACDDGTRTHAAWFVGLEPSHAEFYTASLILCDKYGDEIKTSTPEEEVAEAAGVLWLKSFAANGSEEAFYGAVAALVTIVNSGK
jgi:uncharacterized protein YodC (DUF2158 family)